MKVIIALLLLTTTLAHAAPAAQEKTLLCRVKEHKGHQTEAYSVRIQADGADDQFNLRLYPKVVLQLGTRQVDKEGTEICATLLDYEMPDSETMGDIMVGDTAAYNYLDFMVKLERVKDHEVRISCAGDE